MENHMGFNWLSNHRVSYKKLMAYGIVTTAEIGIVWDIVLWMRAEFCHAYF